MRKISIIVCLILVASSSSFAQNVWTGTTIPTTTLGLVGIGTTTPLGKLQVHANNPRNNTLPCLLISSANGGGNVSTVEVVNYSNPGSGWVPSKDFWINPNGVVGIKKSLRIGTTEATGAFANYKLSVDGDMIAKRCVVQVDNWADFVFNEDYLLPTLNEVEQFVKENKHLPGVPNEQEIKDKGVDVGEMNKILMQKVEELTLYMISQQKEIDTLKAANAVR
jgi:hypothetical protein